MISILFLIINQQINRMRNQINDDCKLQNYQSRKANSHFLGLECILDKYQHENQMLCQKITFLMDENKKLKDRSFNSYNKTAIYESKHRQYLTPRKYQEPSVKKQFTPQQYNESKSKYEGVQRESAPPSLNLNKKYLEYKEHYKQLMDSARTERKYSYLNKLGESTDRKKSGLKPYPDITSVDSCSNNSGRRTYRNQTQNCNLSKQRQITENANQLQLISKFDKTRVVTEPSQAQYYQPQKAAFSRIFNRNVYLQKETFIDDQSQDKVPTFVQASFGQKGIKQQMQSASSQSNSRSSKGSTSDRTNQWVKKQSNNYQINIKAQLKSKPTQKNRIILLNQQILKPINREKRQKKQMQSLEKCYKLQKRQIEQNQLALNKIKLMKQANLQQKQNIQLIKIHKKTNQPYIGTGFKLQEPKTQLTKLFLPDRCKEKEEEEKEKGLSIILQLNSKELSEINDSKQSKGTEGTTQQRVFQPIKQYFPDQRKCRKDRNNSIFGKKKYLNVMSKKPKPSIFLK